MSDERDSERDTAGEPVQERFSEAEARFDAWRRRIALPLGPVAGLLAALAAGVETEGGRLAGIMAFAAIWWIGEAVPVAVTSLAAAAAVVIFGVATPKQAFGAFGSPTLFLFVGSFFIAEAMKLSGLGARVARGLARRAGTQLSLLVALSGAAFLMSMWMSNTASTAVTLPIALSVAAATGDRRYAAAMVLAIAYGASVGGVGTPVGTPPNLIGIGRLREIGAEIGFLRWMSVAAPIGAVMLVVLWLVLARRFGLARGKRLPEAALGVGGEAAAAWSRREIAVACCFALAVVGWFGPGLLDAVAPEAALSRWSKAHLTEEVVALAAALPLFFWPVGADGGGGGGSRAALTWSEATRIDWGTILLFGGGMLLGDLADKTGLTASWGKALVDATGAESVWALTALLTAISIALSEATSNTATATLMVPLAISLARGAGVPVEPPVLGAVLGASFGFMLPISTAPNALAYGTGAVSIRQMMGAGIVFDVAGFVVIVAGLRVLCPLLL